MIVAVPVDLDPLAKETVLDSEDRDTQGPD